MLDLECTYVRTPRGRALSCTALYSGLKVGVTHSYNYASRIITRRQSIPRRKSQNQTTLENIRVRGSSPSEYTPSLLQMTCYTCACIMSPLRDLVRSVAGNHSLRRPGLVPVNFGEERPRRQFTHEPTNYHNTMPMNLLPQRSPPQPPRVVTARTRRLAIGC